jgi:hypothetical protein
MTPFSLLQRYRHVALLSSVCVLSACSSLTESNVTLNRYGAITITAKNAAAGRATASINAVFFEGLSAAAPSSAAQQGDQCAYALVDTAATGATGSLKVGESLALTFAGNNVALPYSASLLRYQPAAGTVLSYGVGDAATVSIPGAAAVFPATAVSVKLAEPIVPSPVATPAAGSPLVVNWNGTNDASAAIILSVRYGATPTAATANEQIYCALKDDGAFQIPATGLNAFQASPSALRSLALIRWRTNEVRPDASTLLHIVSTVDTIVRLP